MIINKLSKKQLEQAREWLHRNDWKQVSDLEINQLAYLLRSEMADRPPAWIKGTLIPHQSIIGPGGTMTVEGPPICGEFMQRSTYERAVQKGIAPDPNGINWESLKVKP